MEIPFSPPDIREEDIQAVVDVLRSGWITTGKVTKNFEEALTAYNGCARTVCFNSATAALELALRLLNIGPGDEVITSAYTYTASCSVILHVGATPILVDTLPDSVLLDPHKVARAITPRTKAVIPVDLGGILCDYPAIYAVLEDKKAMFTPNSPMQAAIGRVAVVTDGAHSLGAIQDGVRSGNLADFTSFSFHAIKNLTTAEGGALSWRENSRLDNAEIYRQLMLLSLHGQTKDALKKDQLGAWEYDIMIPGYKCNMTDIASALGLSQLKRYDTLLKRRHEMLGMYEAAFAGTPIGLLQHNTATSRSSAHLAITRISGANAEQRGEIIRRMSEHGASANVHYKPLPLLTAYRNLGFSPVHYPNAMAFYENEITMPLYTKLTDEQLIYEADALKNAVAAVL